ncbi:MAG: hypothetical protein J6X03_02200 [Bacilli bacterium]|nr:hypothetical protein [Bacilli bacterium]
MFKKLSLTFYINAVGALLALVALIIAVVSNGIAGYAINNFGLIVLFSILGLAGVGAMMFLGEKFGNDHHFTAIARIAAIIFVGIALVMVITNRVDVAGSLSWDRENQAAKDAWSTGLVSTIIFAVADIIFIVTGFFSSKKEEVAQSVAA